MRAKLLEREWLILISLGLFFLSLVWIAYCVKESIDPGIEDFFKEKKNEEERNFRCTK